MNSCFKDLCMIVLLQYAQIVLFSLDIYIAL